MGKFDGAGLVSKILESHSKFNYKPLTIEDLKKFLRSINRHKLRDAQGRFKKKPIKFVFASGYYTQSKVITL